MRIALSPQVLEWALHRSNRQEKLERTFPKIGEWLSGAIQPTLRQLEDFAKAASVPFGYLLLPEPPEEVLPIANFRTLANESIRRFTSELLDTIHKMQRRQAWMREYLIEQGHEPLSFIGAASLDDEPSDIAKKIRRTLGIDDNWAKEQESWSAALRALESKIEDAGILVMVNGVVGNNTHRKLEPDEFRGFVLADNYAPLLFVNGTDGKAAQMFTLAHELAHLWLGRSAAFDLRDLQPADDAYEQACNRIAAEFLIPSSLLITLWPDIAANNEAFQHIARRFKVSEIVAARRVFDLGLIGRDTFFGFYREWQQSEYIKSRSTRGGGDYYMNQNLRIGRRFGEALVQSVQEGKTSYTEAYRLSDLNRMTFQRYADDKFGRRV